VSQERKGDETKASRKKEKQNKQSIETGRVQSRALCTQPETKNDKLPPMADRPHKAHRPAQSGAKADKKAKGKEKQSFNEKVHTKVTYLLLD
jgi:hypothetical protein